MQQVSVARNLKSSTPLQQNCNGVDRNGVDDFNLFQPVQPPASDVELKQMWLLRWIYNAFIISLMIISCYGYLFIKMRNRGDGVIKLLACFFNFFPKNIGISLFHGFLHFENHFHETKHLIACFLSSIW